jgi:BACON domain-containing protein
LTIPNRVVDLGSASTSGEFSLSNSGGQPLTWSIESSASPFGLSAAIGQLDPGETTVILVTLNRGSAAEGTQIRDVSIASSSGTGVAVEFRAVVEHPPTVVITHAAKSPVCPQYEVETIVATVNDESGLNSVVLTWSGPGKSGSAPMQFKGGWSAPLNVPYIEGIWSYTVTATDARGNTATAPASTEVLCPPPG